MNRTWWHALLRRNPSLRRKTLTRIRQANRQALSRYQPLQMESLESRLLLAVVQPAILDFGDAPDSYSTLAFSNGPQHITGMLRLGELVDAEYDGIPTQNADGDGEDDDGVTFTRIYGSGESGFVVNVTGSTSVAGEAGGARLDAWLDWNADGDFDDPGEQIAANLLVMEGPNVLAVSAPAGAVAGVTTYARFRISSEGNLLPTGAAADGEVEDYALTLTPVPSVVFAGPAFENMAAGFDPDASGPIVAVGFDAFTSLEQARAAVEPGGKVIYYAAGTPADDRLEVTFENNSAVYTLNGSPLSIPANVDGFGFAGFDGNDLVTVNLAGGSFASLVGSLYFSGGTQTTELGDGLIVRGSGTESAVYTPSATDYGDGKIEIDQGLVVFSGLEPVDFTGLVTATLNLPGADDVVTLASGVDFLAGGTNQAIRATGTSNGVGFEAAAFWNNTTVVINTSTVDGNDTINITSADNAHNNANLTINTGGTGSDSVNSNGPAVFTGTVTITVNGTINDGNAAALNIQAATLNITAAGAVDLDTNVNTLSANTSGGNAAQTFREVNNTAIATLNAGTGAITLAGGTFNLSTGTSLADASSLVVNGPGVLSLNGFNESVQSLAGTGTFDLGSNQLTILGTNAAPVSFDGLLVGSGTLVKQGAGTQALAGNSTSFSGTTNVTGGVLQITATTTINPLGTSNVTLNGGNLTFAGELTPNGLLGRYYNRTLPNINNSFPEFSFLAQTNSYLLDLAPAVTAVSNVDYANAGFGGAAPFASVGFAATDNIVAYWSGKIDLPAGATTFNTRSDDGSMIFINGQTVVNNNFFQGATTRSGTFTAPTAGLYDIVVTFYEGGGGAGVQAWNGAAGTPSGFTLPIFAYQPQLALNNNIAVTGNSTITVTDMVGVTLGNLTHTVGTTLNSAGAGILRFNGTTTYSGSGTATYNVSGSGGDLVFAGQVNDAGDNVTIVKAGPGQAIYNNTTTGATANDIDGPINVTGGQLVLIGANAGSNPGDTAPINLNAAGVSLVHRSKTGNPTFTNPINFNANANLASYLAPTGVVTNISTGTITLAAGVTGTLVAFDTIQQIDGQITGAGNLAKQGVNNSILNNNTNSYSGSTEIQAGVLVVAQSNGLGATSGDTSVLAGGQLRLQNNITIPAGETVTIRGNGPGNGGAIRNENGNNAITDGVVLAASAIIFGNGGTLTLPGGIALGNFGLTVDGGGTVTVPGVISGTMAEGLLEGHVPGNGFDQTGPNPGTTIVLGPEAGRETTGNTRWPTGARTWIYTGQFFDADGIFSFAENIDDNVLIRVNGVQVLNNTQWNVPTTTGIITTTPGWVNIDIRFGDGGGGAGAVAGSGWTVAPPVTHGFGLNVNGSTSTNGADYVFPLEPVGGGATLFRVVDGGITKQGAGTLRLTNAGNTYNGATNITNGRVQITNNTALGTTASGTTVTGTGTLELDGAFDFTTTEPLTLSGSGVGGIGALNSINGNRNVPIPLTLAGSTTFGSGTVGNTMTISGAINWPIRSTIAFAGAGDINVTSVLGTGVAPTTTNGFDERFFTFGFDANTVQNNVTAMLATTPNISKTLTNHLSFVNDAAFDAEAGVTLPAAFSALWFASFTPDESGVWQFQYNNVDDNASVWIDFNQNGVFENVATERIHARGCCGGSGVFSTPGVTAGQSYNFVIAMSDTGGGGAFNDFEVKKPSGAFEDLIPSATSLTGIFALTSPAHSIVKNGTGVVTLSGANAYDGRTTINQGTLVAAHATALGLVVGNTVINNGGTLGFAGNVAVANELLSVNGVGGTQPGAIVNISGNNTYTGTITAQVVSQGQIGIGSNAGTLTVNGPLNLQFSRLVLGGAGSTVINSVISGNGAPALNPGINERIFDGVPADAQANIEAYRNAPLGAADAQGTLTGHLSYANDAAFSARAAALGAVGFDNGNFSAVWTSLFTPNETGIWGFRFNNLDDNASIWVDYDQDGILENPGALGSERIYNRGCCGGSGDQFTTSLTSGQTYLWGIAMSDTGGGGNFVNVEVKSPSGAWVPLNPSALGTMFQVQTLADNSVVKVGTGSATLTGNNTYNGNTTINAGTLIVASNTALGTATPGTTVNPGGSLGFQGGVNYTANELLTINGLGAGGTGAVKNISGNNRFVPNITAQLAAPAAVSIGSDAGTLTLEGTISLGVSSLDVVGAGNVTLNGVISGLGAPTFVGTGGLNGQYYNLTIPPNTPAAEAMLRGTGHNVIGLDGFVPTATVFTPRVDFGVGTDVAPGDGTVLDRGGLDGNVFGGIGLNIGNDNVAGVWTGFINIPVGGADYEFTTRSDDGSRLWVDVDNNGTFEASELVVDNNFLQGMTNRSGVRTLTAGLHRIRIAGFEAGGGAGFQASWAQLTGAGAFARRIIEPAALRDETMTVGGLTGRYYNAPGATTLLDPVGLPLPLQALTVTVSALTPRVDFGTGTETAPGDGTVLDRGGTTGNPFGGIGVNVGLDQHAAVWSGKFLAPETATYRFTTRSDDGTVLYIDGKRIVDNNFFQGMTNRSGDIILTAGVHEILIAGYEGAGGAGFQASWEQLNGTTPFPRRIIEPSIFGDELPSNNLLTKSGTGTLILTAANTYNNGTVINGGVLLANNTAGSATGPAAVTVNSTGTLGGNGSVAGVVTVNNGGILSPGVAGVGDLALITPVFNATGIYNAQFAPGPSNGILAVTGAVNLGGNVSFTTTNNGGFVPAPSSTYVLIQNDGVDPVVGTFAGLPEGAQFTSNFLGTGLNAFITYTAGTGNDVGIFVAGPATFNGTAANEDFEVRRIDAGGGVHLLQVLQPIGGAIVFSAPYAAISAFTLNAGDGNDNIFVNHGASGGFIATPMFINGGNQTDTLRVGGGTVVTATHTFVNDTNGSLDQSGTLLTYTGIESATDNLVTTNRIFAFTGAAETIVLDNDAAVGVSRIDSTLGVVTAFNNPSALLTINLTNGNDTLNVQELDAAFNAGLTITQDGGDTVNFQTAGTNLGAGALNVTANSIAFSQTVTTTGNATLTAVANITNTGAGVDIVAANLVATAATGVDLDTTVTNLTVTSTGVGNVQIDETNGANVLNVAAGIGSVVVNTTTGNLSVTLASATTGNVTLSAPAGAITDANAAANNITASGTLTATSLTGVALDTNVAAIIATASGAGAIVLNETNAVTLSNVTAANGLITITAGGAITATNVVSTTDNDANDITLTATAGSITVSAVAAGSGVAGDVTISAAAGSILDDNNDTTRIVGDVVTLIALNDIGAPLTGPQTEDIDTTANTLIATATGVLAGTHGIWIDETNGVSLQNVTTADGLIRITTAGDTTATLVNAGGTGRNVTIISSVGNLLVNSITADQDRITLTAPGAIQETGAGDAGVDLTAGQLVLTAGTGIGVGAGGALETVAGAVEANGGSGGLFLSNMGDLTIGGLTALVGLSATGGGITITTTGAINVNENIIASGAGGAVLLTAVDAVTAGQNINVLAGVTISSAASTVTINAGDNVSLPAGTTVAAATGIVVNIDFGNADPGVGGVLDFAGDLDDIAGPVTAAIFNGNSDTFGDTFNIRPDQDVGGFVPITVFGFAPAANPNGDNMSLDLAGLTDRTLTIGGVNSGQWSFGTQAGAVAYNSIENVGGTGGNFNLVLDMLFGGFQDGVPDTVLVRLDPPGTSLLVDVNGINQFTGPDASISSFTVIGSGDADTLQIVETAGGMPFFAGPAPALDNTLTGGGISNGSHINSVSTAILTAQFPGQAPWDANDVSFHFAGGGGTDTMQVTYITPHSVGYSSDALDTAGSGNLGSFRIGGPTADLLASFAGIEVVSLTGAGGLVYVDPSLTAATVVQVSNSGAPNDGVNQVTANGPFTPVTFSNFNQALVVGGTGSQLMEVLSTDSGGAIPLTSLQVSGDNATGTDPAIDTLRIYGSTPGVVTTLIGGGGNDLFQVFDASNSVNNILGQVIVNGGTGTDTLVVTDSGSATGKNITITESQINGMTGFAGAPDIIYSNSVEILDVTGTSGNDVLATTLSAGPSVTTMFVRGADGDDVLTLVTNDPVTGVASVNLIGNEGLDNFGTVATPIRPSTTTVVNIDGGNPTGPVLPVSDTIGDRLRLDMTATTGPVIVNTVGGVATSGSHRPVNFVDIEDIDLVDDTFTAVQMGDLYVRGTDGVDFMIFARLVGSDPNLVRARLNTTFQDVIVTRAIIAYGRGGNDYLNQSNVPLMADFHGEAGDDYISGGIANDRLVGGSGADLINGSLGDNEIWGDNLGEQSLAVGGDDVLSALSGNDVFYGGGGDDQISAGAGNDYIYGGMGNDTIGGAQGDDRIYGDAGDDVISGDEGNDLISGGSGDDQLFGRDGNDVLIGGSGQDMINGGNGSDLIISSGVAGETSLLPGDASDLALLALLTNWGSTGSNRTGLPTIIADSDVDSLLGSIGDDDFSAGMNDLLSDFNTFGMETDEQF